VTDAIALTEAEAVAAWVRHQGLGEPAGSTPAEVVAATGWLRTVGGVDGYLALAARLPGVRAADVHAAIAAGDLVVSQAARGCVYVVPRAHAPLALALARDLNTRRDARDAEKAGVEPGELDRVGAAVLAALRDGPLTTVQLRRALPDGVVRPLGDRGKKVGITSTLPPALRVLEFAGRIQRRPVDDRLDHERYGWVRTAGDVTPVDPRPEATRDVDLARLVLRWFAPASVDVVADFLGLTKARVTRALAALDTVEVAVAGPPGVVLAEQVATLRDPAPAAPRFLPGLDNLLTWHGGPAPFVHPDDLDRRIRVWGRQKDDTWRGARHVLARVVLAGGVVQGEWELDLAAGEVVTSAYGAGLPDGVEAAAGHPLALLQELGHGRPFSLDKDEQVAARAAALRAS
jgi:hypothetical protein